MIDFWMPETKFDVPKLDLSRYDRMPIGEVDTWTIWSGVNDAISDLKASRSGILQTTGFEVGK